MAALVVQANEVVSVDRLADILWGEGQPTDTAGAVQTYISRLRAVLEAGASEHRGAALVTQAPGYVLQVDPENIDAARFERLIGEARTLITVGQSTKAIDALDEGLALWTGRAFAEFADLDFARAESLRLEELRRVAHEDRVDAMLSLRATHGRHRRCRADDC